MWIEKSEQEIIEMENNKKAIYISLWENADKAKSYYDKHENLYTGFNNEKPIHALATPFKVYQLV